MGIKNFYSNEEIIEGIRSNNPKIISFIYEQYFPMMNKMIINNYKGTTTDAKDVFQDSLIIIYEGIMSNSLLLLQNSFIALLTTICKRKMIDRIRRNMKLIHYENEDILPFESYQEILELADKTERIKLYQKHFNEIGEKCQKLIKLVLDGYSINEITKKLNFINENYTKRRRNQCKESLFKKIYFDSQLKELIYGKPWTIREIPRW